MQSLTKTIKLRLYTTAEQSAMFRQMSEQYREACNFVSQYIFDHDFELNSAKLNKILYRNSQEGSHLYRWEMNCAV